MKNILLASTVLAMSAGFAAAESHSGISMSGGGYAGVTNDGNASLVVGANSDGVNGFIYHSRFQINFDGTAESDSGVSVAARIRIRSSESGATSISAPRINVTAGGLTVSLGNTSSALDANTNAYASCVGNVGDFCADSVAGSGFSSGAAFRDRIRVDYAFGDWTVSASGQIDGGEDAELAVKGKLGNFGVAVGYKVNGVSAAQYVVDLNGSFGTVNAGLRYENTNGGASQASLYGNTTFGATTLSAYVTNDTANEWGVGVSHDLGGGIAVGAAMADGNRAQAHVSFSF